MKETSKENRYLLERQRGSAFCDTLCGVPLCGKNGDAATRRFSVDCNTPTALGTNCRISLLNNKLVFEGKQGAASVNLGNAEMPHRCIDGMLCGGKAYIQATPNGAVFFCRCAQGEKTEITVTTDIANEAIRKNNKYVAFMQKPFRPSLTVAALYSISADGMHYRPLILESASPSIYKQDICLYSSLSVEHINVFEINMYEPKLMQDTTVESATATQNNAYGATAFVGRTDEYGEQWLYLKANMRFLKYLNGKELLSAKLHIPILSGSGEHLEAFMLPSRFCSFGSNWNNKLAYVPDAIAKKSTSKANCVTFDITGAIAEGLKNKSKESAGILVLNRSKTDCVLLATGDCYTFPQMMEIEYK